MTASRAPREIGRVRVLATSLAIGALAAGCGGHPSSQPVAGQGTAASNPADDAARRVAPSGSALAAIARLEVKGRAPTTGYSRDQFGDGWASVDGCDTRDRILSRDLRAKTFRAATDRCVVMSGRLADPYTSTTIAYVRGGGAGVDIDHVVALGDAWRKGAQRWPHGERVAFANDPLNLLAVDAFANRQKGDGDTATWLPKNKAFRCTYVARQVSVKLKYAISVTRAEHEAMLRVLAKCPSTRVPVAGRLPTAVTPTRTKPARPTASSDARAFANCAAARAAGAAPIRRGTALYAPNQRLDRDMDGVACE
jgi:hypothetical protein